jgi:hypothetical protein
VLRWGRGVNAWFFTVLPGWMTSYALCCCNDCIMIIISYT